MHVQVLFCFCFWGGCSFAGFGGGGDGYEVTARKCISFKLSYKIHIMVTILMCSNNIGQNSALPTPFKWYGPLWYVSAEFRGKQRSMKSVPGASVEMP